MAKFATPVNLT